MYIHNYIIFLIGSCKISTAMVLCAAVGFCSESRKSAEIEQRQFATRKKISEPVSFILKMNVSNETWRYLIICCEDF